MANYPYFRIEAPAMDPIPLPPSIPHVLVVDDEPDVADLFRLKFRRELRAGEIAFSFAENGAEALAVVQADPSITVVFTDINMPVMNGLALLAQLRQLDERPLRSVVVSAYGDMDNIRTAMRSGAMDFIVKPIDLQDLEATLHKAIREVEAVIAAVTVRARLQHSEFEKEAAHQARRAQQEFFDNITHELRTPLTLLLGPLEQALDRTRDQHLLHLLQRAHRNGQQLHTLIDELLDTARIGAGALELQLARADFGAFCGQVAEDFAPLARARGIAYAIEVPETACYADFDAAKVRKIIVNLLSNAMKFTGEGGRVGLRLEVDADGQARLQVADSGRGISPEALPRVFERFYRGDEGGGTGIGLSFARRLAELHGGQLSARSVLGEGSTFILEMPLVLQEPPVRLPAQAEAQVQESADPTELPSVLVVEDHPEMRAHIQACLDGHYQVLLAADGQQGWDMALAQLPDLIVTDWAMPGMDGKALCLALRQDMATSHIPIVLLTAKAGIDQRLEGLEGGADVYLSKPFHREELLLQLRNLRLRQQAQRRHIGQDLPLTPEAPQVESMDAQFIARVKAVLQRELANERFGVEQLADALGMSRKTLHRKLSAVTGQNPNATIRNFRLDAAMHLLKSKAGPVGEVAYLTGFSSHSYFSKCFQEYFQIAPSDV